MGQLLYITEEQQKPSGSQLVPLADLEKFRVTLMIDIKLMREESLGKSAKRWLKSYEVRKLLNISYGTLQILSSQLSAKSCKFYQFWELDSKRKSSGSFELKAFLI